MERKSMVEAAPIYNNKSRRPRPWPPGIEPFFSNADHNPHELKSWANRTGFNQNLSGESTLSSIIDEREEDVPAPAPPPPLGLPGKGDGPDLEKGLGSGLGKVQLEPIFGQIKAGADINPVNVGLKEKRRIGVEPDVGLKEEGNDLLVRGIEELKKDEVDIDLLVDDPLEPQSAVPFKSGLLCDIMDYPGFG